MGTAARAFRDAPDARHRSDGLDVVTMGETMVLLAASSEGRMRFVTKFERLTGGAESNFAIGIARLGLRPGWIGRVGSDEFGEVVLSRLKSEGVDTSRVVYDPDRPTGIFFKERSEGGLVRALYYRRHDAASAMTRDDIDESYLKGARAFHVTGITFALSASTKAAATYALETARRAGIPASFDANVRLRLRSRSWWKRVLLAVIPHVDVVFATGEEAYLITGSSDPEEASKSLQQMGPQSIVIKEGARGSFIRVGANLFRQPAIPVERVVNSDGAGDAYAAGFIGGTLLGLTPEHSAELGAILGAGATQAFGGTEGLPTLPEIRLAMGNHGP